MDHTDRIPQIKVPTLLLWGLDDYWIPANDTLHYLRDLPQLQLKVMKNTGHVPMEERPKESLELVRDFLNVVAL